MRSFEAATPPNQPLSGTTPTGIEYMGPPAVQDMRALAVRQTGFYPDGNYSYDWPRPSARLQALRTIIERGEVPNLPNGWRYVYVMQPDGHQNRDDDNMSSLDYTWCFAGRLAPMAPPGHRRHERDQDRAVKYLDMFECEEFGDVVQQGARVAVDAATAGDLSRCETFTEAFGKLSDALVELQVFDNKAFGPTPVPAVMYGQHLWTARQRLHDLVALQRGGSADDAERFADEPLFRRLWAGLGLERLEESVHWHDKDAWDF